MYLKSLILRGFKSFGKKSELSFDSGISVIVGPNGSGKSNIADAVSWVLGQQSPKSLRSSSMDEVIFRNKNEELGIAEVSLVFDNKDKRIPLEFRDIKFTRRVYSRGGSDYFINSSPSRLIDIQDIISDAGIGKGLYTIIRQGEIDEIALLKPEERREVVDEIIGITKHKSRKDKSVNKLDNISENISRVEDIMFEIKKTMNPLKVEAEKAQKYFEIKNSLKDNELSLYVYQLNALNRQWEEMNNNLEKLKIKNMKIGSEEKTVLDEREKIDSEIKAIEKNYFQIDKMIKKIEEFRNKLDSYSLVILSKINTFKTLANLTNSELYGGTKTEIESTEFSDLSLDIKELIESLKELKLEIQKFFRNIKSQSVSVEMVLEIEKSKVIIEKKIDSLLHLLEKNKTDTKEITFMDKEIKKELFVALNELTSANIKSSNLLKELNKRLLISISIIIDKYQPELKNFNKMLEEKTSGLNKSQLKENEIVSKKNKIENDIFRLDIKKEQIKEKVKDITMMVTDNYNVSIDYLQKNYRPCEDVHNTETKIRELKTKLRNIGVVNPNARIEYNRIKERYDFLEKEKYDLVESRKDLENIISDIDSRIRKLFMENFTKINERFMKNFKLLFPLGSGELLLTGSKEMIDDIGIDLKIDMGNNKLVPLTLLSGGEKSLVSIAFLFSVYGLNFSPFYLLDEVDAALDDMNLNRFLNLLKDFSSDKQVILITHQKRTMEVADTIYGVSMQSNGISKIVSVKLNGNAKDN